MVPRHWELTNKSISNILSTVRKTIAMERVYWWGWLQAVKSFKDATVGVTTHTGVGFLVMVWLLWSHPHPCK